jgi:hypothetical protein
MKNLFKLFILTAVLISSVGCKKYLDINSDPDTPQFPDASSVFPAMLSAIPRGTQYDADLFQDIFKILDKIPQIIFGIYMDFKVTLAQVMLAEISGDNVIMA